MFIVKIFTKIAKKLLVKIRVKIFVTKISYYDIVVNIIWKHRRNFDRTKSMRERLHRSFNTTK